MFHVSHIWMPCIYICIYAYIDFLFKLVRRRFVKSRNILKVFKNVFLLNIKDITIKYIQS